MSNRPFFAARVELFLDRGAEKLFRLLGWNERVIGYTGYASEDAARLLGRVVLSPAWSTTQIGKATEEFLRRRGWRNFFTAPCVHARYCVKFGDTEASGTTDRGGYVDHRLRDHHLEPGWHTADICSEESESAKVAVRVVPRNASFGIVSDIDDTVLFTWLPRPFIAAWNSFMRTEAARQAIPGMAVLYRDLLAAHPGAPLIYVSTGAWNTHGFLRRFLHRHRYPPGPMLLTDWGPTNTGWFRSGPDHKRGALLQLSVDFPDIAWLLVGDDGQHDPEVYGEFARRNPDRTRAIAIRTLTPAEQLLSHGTAEPREPDPHEVGGVPIVRAPDGRELAPLVRAALGLDRRTGSGDRPEHHEEGGRPPWS